VKTIRKPKATRVYNQVIHIA